MTRIATVEDIPALVEMGRAFHRMSPHKFMGDYDGAAVGRVLSMLILDARGLVVTNGEGAIGGLIAPVYFDPSKRQMEEAFLYASSGGRDLIKEFCRLSKEMGADFVLLSTLENDRVLAVDRLVTRMGFKPVERRYVKELK